MCSGIRLGLFGGSFDPPHRGHLLVAQAALLRCRLDRVLLAPAGRQPLKAVGASASFADRLAMTALLCGMDVSGALQASDLDAPLATGEPNYTVHTLERLQHTAPNAALFVITGADSFLELRRWREPERLLQQAEWIVVSRPGSEARQLDALQLKPDQRARVHWLGDVHDPVSATDVRGRLEAGLDCGGLVPAPVLGYIREHALYSGS